MANYTITLRDLIRRKYNIFDDSWSTFDPAHKEELCNKIIRHYWFYEIGQETPDRFKFTINEHLALIMPYYNQLYQSELLKIEPLYDRYMEETTGVKRDRNLQRGVAQRVDVNRLKEMAEAIKKMGEGTSDMSGNQNVTGHENWKEDRTIHTTENTDQDTTEHTTKGVEFSEKEAAESKEVMTDAVTGNKTTDGTSTTDGTLNKTGSSDTTTSATRRYSDTPQARINSSDLSIEQQYLTNYTRDNGSSNTDTKEDQTSHEQTTTHTEEDMKSDETRNTDTTQTKDTTSTENTTQDVKGTNDIDKTIDTTDGVVGSRDKTQGTTTTEDVKTTSKEDGFTSGSENERQSQTGYTDEGVHEKEGEDRTHVTRGFTISQAELLTAYRGTFLNIDQKIIEELAVDFMGIF